MGSLSNPKTWVPYWNKKDCSQGFCSFYCPQWCYIVYPPPPPLDFPDDGGGGGPSSSFSPLVVAIIGILASAFLLVSYYTIISKYCGRGNADQGRRSVGENPVGDEFNAENRSDPSFQEPWHVATAGLDEAAIKAIAVCRYRRGEGLVEGTDCSVCLSEFQEDESVRLLPKCGHAFHIQCIDTWLRSHSNCPLCRANVICVGPQDAATDQSPFADGSTAGIEVVVVGQNSSSGVDREVENNVANVVPPKNANASSLRAFSDLGYLEERHAVIEVRDEIRRSVSMDFSRPNRVLVADILRTNSGAEEEEEDGQDDYVDVEECSLQRASCSKFVNWKYNNINGRRKGILHCVMSPVAMKRSVSSGRFFLSRNTIIPP